MDKQYINYHIDLEIDVENQLLYSNTIINYYCNLSSSKVLNFYIYKDIVIEDITCDRAMTYEVGKEIAEWSPFVLESKCINLIFDQPILERERIEINFKYIGNINISTLYGVNRLTKEWIELGIYSPWFPLYEGMELTVFDVNIRIKEGYQIINAKKYKDFFRISQSVPSVDCTILASNSFKQISCDQNSSDINIFYTDDNHEGTAQQINHYSKKILNIYRRFGQLENQTLSIVIAPRENGGGYSRPGLIVLMPSDDEEDETDYFKFIAHEIAHLWWCKAKETNTYEDWLNESFAEFSALLALREVFGEEAFNSKIQIYTQSTKNLPPIMNMDRGSDKAHKMLYMKGPLILNELEKNIGKEKFEELLSEIYISNIDTTDKFLNKLLAITNKEVKENFNSLLCK